MVVEYVRGIMTQARAPMKPHVQGKDHRFSLVTNLVKNTKGNSIRISIKEHFILTNKKRNQRFKELQELAAELVLSKNLPPDLSHTRAHFPLTYLPEEVVQRPYYSFSHFVIVFQSLSHVQVFATHRL